MTLRAIILVMLTALTARAAPGLHRGAYSRIDAKVRARLDRLPTFQPGQAVAVLDADHTLWRGDLGTSFCKWMLRKGHLPRQNRPALVAAWRQWKQGKLADVELFKHNVTCMKGMKQRTVERLAASYYRRAFRDKTYAPMKALIRALQDKGVEVWAVSGSNSSVLRPGLRQLGIPGDKVLGMDVAIEHGRLTDRFVRVTWQDGKARAIDSTLGRRRIVAGAGDSYGDLAMIDKVERGGIHMLINPTPSLAREGRGRGWTIQELTAADQLASR